MINTLRAAFHQRIATSPPTQSSLYNSGRNPLKIIKQRIPVWLIDISDSVADMLVGPQILRKDVDVVLAEDAVDL